MRKLFGTDGIRGVANIEPMTAEMAYKLGKCCAIYFTRDKKERIVFLIGKDTRLSCDMLENAITAGLCSYGVDVIKIGILPTPAVAYLTKKYKADCGIMISASHNSFEDNGIKLFSNKGHKLSENIEDDLTKMLHEENIPVNKPLGSAIGRVVEDKNAVKDYLSYVISTIPVNTNLSSLKIVVDCANGATSYIAAELFENLGIKIKLKHNKPTGTNINLNCGSLYPHGISSEIKKAKYNAGLCFDGDGDRVIALDENGEMIDGDYIMAICSKYLFHDKKHPKKILITTTMSNIGLEKFTQEFGIKMIRTNVGDKYVLEEMLKIGAILGGEQSGHIIFKEFSTTGDGIITALQLLSIMANENKKLSSLSKVMKKYPQILINIPVKSKVDFHSIPELHQVIDEIEKEIENNGRLVLRYSGTEPLARIMLEGYDENKIKKIGNRLADAIKLNIG
ncbi:MAG: phosphoglucosamine mutase [Candidatus Firestonebacteria bacterium]|nr:phosphoglucosamine mutase [Candidatus Firestonebacteria bacterium]